MATTHVGQSDVQQNDRTFFLLSCGLPRINGPCWLYPRPRPGRRGDSQNSGSSSRHTGDEHYVKLSPSVRYELRVRDPKAPDAADTSAGRTHPSTYAAPRVGRRDQLQNNDGGRQPCAFTKRRLPGPDWANVSSYARSGQTSSGSFCPVPGGISAFRGSAIREEGLSNEHLKRR